MENLTFFNVSKVIFTISSYRHRSSCRFCLRVLQEDEKQIAINHYIRKQFLVITQTELKSSELYSQIICETCFNSTLEFTNFKASLIESQQKLEESVEVLEADITDEPDCEDVIEMVLKSETVFCNKKIGQNPVKVESLDESCEDESEECDEIDLRKFNTTVKIFCLRHCHQLRYLERCCPTKRIFKTKEIFTPKYQGRIKLYNRIE